MEKIFGLSALCNTLNLKRFLYVLSNLNYTAYIFDTFLVNGLKYFFSLLINFYIVVLLLFLLLFKMHRCTCIYLHPSPFKP